VIFWSDVVPEKKLQKLLQKLKKTVFFPSVLLFAV